MNDIDLPKEFLQDVVKARIRVEMERKSNPQFVPSLAFLQRTMRWGFARASLALPYVTGRTQ